jgi:hypothetical protein
MPPLANAPRGKLEKKLAIANRALADLAEWLVLRRAQHERHARPELVEGRAL